VKRGAFYRQFVGLESRDTDSLIGTVEIPTGPHCTVTGNEGIIRHRILDGTNDNRTYPGADCGDGKQT